MHLTRLGLIVWASVCGAGLQAQQVQRQSADGEPFPLVTNKVAPLKTILPTVRDKLGAVPEDIGARLYSTRKSKALLAKHADPAALDTAFFGWGFGGSDAFGVDLSEGRVVRIVLIWTRENPGRAASIESDMGRACTKVSDGKWKPKNAVDQQVPILVSVSSRSASFALDPVEFYLLNHIVAPGIAAAMRENRLVSEMPVDAAIATLGPPENRGSTFLEWNFRAPERREAVSRVTTLEGFRDDVQSSLLNPPRMVVIRSVRATVRQQTVQDFSDQRFDP